MTYRQLIRQYKMDQPQKAIESQGEEDANMVTAVEESRLLDRDVTMVRETETPRPATAPTGIARPTVRDSPSLTENPMQHRQQPHYSSQGSNSERESANEELQTEVRLRRAMERDGRLVDLTEQDDHGTGQGDEESDTLESLSVGRLRPRQRKCSSQVSG